MPRWSKTGKGKGKGEKKGKQVIAFKLLLIQGLECFELPGYPKK